MSQENPQETLIKQILEKRPELTRQQILDRVAANRDMTGGLIADESLLRIIAAELGVEIPSEDGSVKHRLSLGHLVAGLNNATVTGRIAAIYPVRTFEGPKPGKLGSLTIVDNDGFVRVILWNEQTKLLESGELKVGQIAKFIHGYTKADKFGIPELHIGERSQVELSPQDTKDQDYPTISKFTTKVKDISIDQKSVNLEANVTEIFSLSTFSRSDQTAGKVMRAKIADETGEKIAVFWNEKAEEVEPKIKRGMQIQLINARPRLNQNDQDEIEIHVDASTFTALLEAPKRLLKISSLSSELGEVNLEGQVATLPVCKEVKTSKGELVKLTSFDLQDETGSIRVTTWREHAETACKLFMGEKILLENVYTKIGYNGKLELSTRTATRIARV